MNDSRWQIAAAILGFWLVETVYSAAEVHYRTALSPRPYTWSSAFRAEAIYGALGALLTPGIIWVARRFPVERGVWLRNLGVHVLTASIYAATAKIAWDFIWTWRVPLYLTGGFNLEKLLWSISMGFSFGIALYGLIVLTIYAIGYYQRYQASLVECAKFETQLVQAQLKALRMQLDPHFLFNALHSISELVHEDPEAAEAMIARLSELLRRSLEGSGLQEVPLDEELEFLNLYLAIEKTRFEDRLAVVMDIDPAARQAMVPSLILQPLVENAIRHGISKRVVPGGRITISAERRDGNLLVRVTDNGAGLGPDPGAIHEGVGLSSTRGRLERLYGGGQRLEITPAADGVEARIQIPFHSQPQYATH
jgi:sensor histidine kinase YesM